MYVLCSPCILHPELRATGITKPADIAEFERAIERCKCFDIEMVPLPCPEMLYLGSDRKPGTFLDRLNTPAFASLMETLELQVQEILDERGSPLCILGVNSSPTCGVTSTYRGSDDQQPPKRTGRGVFLVRFPNICTIDVTTFAQYRIYLAAPLFSKAERTYNAMLADLLRQHLFEVSLPQNGGDDTDTRMKTELALIFSKNKEDLDRADIVVAVIDGADVDSGTAWEMGYAYAHNKPVVAVRTDFRRAGTHEQVNLMLEESSKVVSSTIELLESVNSPLIGKRDV
jgi:nucleoside 2-deoxyribosyltransferase/predicted secreted protein